MTDSSEGKSPKLLDRLRQAIRTRHYSPSTEKAYVSWVKRFIFFHTKRHPKEMGEQEVTAFLNHLATKANVSASTQNQALSAILFLYKYVLKDELDWLEHFDDHLTLLHLADLGVAEADDVPEITVRLARLSADLGRDQT